MIISYSFFYIKSLELGKHVLHLWYYLHTDRAPFHGPSSRVQPVATTVDGTGLADIHLRSSCSLIKTNGSCLSSNTERNRDSHKAEVPSVKDSLRKTVKLTTPWPGNKLLNYNYQYSPLREYQWNQRKQEFVRGKSLQAVTLISLQKRPRALNLQGQQNTCSLAERSTAQAQALPAFYTAKPKRLSHSYQSPLDINLLWYLKGIWNPSRWRNGKKKKCS